MTSSTRTSRPTGAIGVLEAGPFFAPELQRQCAGEELTVQSIRKADELDALPVPRVCVLAMGPDQEAAIRFLQRSRHDPATACVVVVPAGPDAALEWLLRENGAASVMDRFVRGDELAAICRKLLNSMNENHV